jgi:putative transposase
MGDIGACWDNAVVERFFSSLKHDRLLKVAQPTREYMRDDVAVNNNRKVIHTSI